MEGHPPGQGVDVGHQRGPQPDELCDGVVEGRALLPKAPNLPGGVGAVGAHHGHKGAQLQPAGVQLPVAQILAALGIVAAAEPILARGHEEPADVKGPVGLARGGEVQPLGDLAAQGLPAGADVPGPGDGGVAVLAGEGGAGQVDHALLPGGGALALVNATGVVEGIGGPLAAVQVFLGGLGVNHGPLVGLGAQGKAAPVGLERLGAIAPPGVHAVLEDALLGLLPVEVPGLFGESVIGGAVAQHVALLQHLPLVIAHTVHVGPDGHHQRRAQLVEPLHHGVGFGIAGGVKGLLPPLARLPRLPVLDDKAEGDVPPAVLLHRADELLGGFVVLLGLAVAIGPLGQQRRCAGELAVGGQHPGVLRGGQEVVVQLVHNVHPHVRAVAIVLEGHQRAAVEQEAVALGGHKAGHAGLHVLLVELAALAPEVAVALLVGAEAVEALVPKDELHLGVVGHAVLHGLIVAAGDFHPVGGVALHQLPILGEDVAGHLGFHQVAAACAGLPHQDFPGGGQVGQGAGGQIHPDGAGLQL